MNHAFNTLFISPTTNPKAFTYCALLSAWLTQQTKRMIDTIRYTKLQCRVMVSV